MYLFFMFLVFSFYNFISSFFVSNGIKHRKGRKLTVREYSSHGKGACAQAVSYTFRPEVLAVAASAVNFSVGGIVHVCRVQRAAAFAARETSLVPKTVLADHLFGCVYWVSTTTTTVSGSSFISNIGPSLTVKNSWANTIRANKSWGVTETKSFRSEEFAVAGSAVDFTVGTVAGQHRVERSVAFGAVETFLVPHLEIGNIILNSSLCFKITINCFKMLNYCFKLLLIFLNTN